MPRRRILKRLTGRLIIASSGSGSSPAHQAYSVDACARDVDRDGALPAAGLAGPASRDRRSASRDGMSMCSTTSRRPSTCAPRGTNRPVRSRCSACTTSMPDSLTNMRKLLPTRGLKSSSLYWPSRRSKRQSMSATPLYPIALQNCSAAAARTGLATETPQAVTPQSGGHDRTLRPVNSSRHSAAESAYRWTIQSSAYSGGIYSCITKDGLCSPKRLRSASSFASRTIRGPDEEEPTDVRVAFLVSQTPAFLATTGNVALAAYSAASAAVVGAVDIGAATPYFSHSSRSPALLASRRGRSAATGANTKYSDSSRACSATRTADSSSMGTSTERVPIRRPISARLFATSLMSSCELARHVYRPAQYRDAPAGVRPGSARAKTGRQCCAAQCSHGCEYARRDRILANLDDDSRNAVVKLDGRSATPAPSQAGCGSTRCHYKLSRKPMAFFRTSRGRRCAHAGARALRGARADRPGQLRAVPCSRRASFPVSHNRGRSSGNHALPRAGWRASRLVNAPERSCQFFVHGSLPRLCVDPRAQDDEAGDRLAICLGDPYVMRSWPNASRPAPGAPD